MRKDLWCTLPTKAFKLDRVPENKDVPDNMVSVSVRIGPLSDIALNSLQRILSSEEVRVLFEVNRGGASG